MPMFFMSYARVPAPRHRDASQDPNRLVFQFFDELCGKVARHARVSREEAGFVERPGTPGEKSIKALLGCREERLQSVADLFQPRRLSAGIPGFALWIWRPGNLSRAVFSGIIRHGYNPALFSASRFLR